MAQIDKVYLVNRSNPFDTVNVTGAIGIGERNEKNDVLLVQTLFKIIGSNENSAKLSLGRASTELPEITDIFDNNTVQTIWSFQRANASHLLNIDGKIHHADYKNRIIKEPWKRKMAIMLLTDKALDMALLGSNNLDFISTIKNLAPDLVLKPFDPWA